MKTLSIIVFSLSLSLAAAAQHKTYYHSYQPHVYVAPSVGFGFGYPYYGYPFGYPYYGPYGYMNPYYNNNRMPYKLSLEIQSIKVDYKNKIRNARKDKSISHSARRQEIRNLKADRDEQIISAQQNFRQRRMNNNYQNNAPQNNSDNGSNS